MFSIPGVSSSQRIWISRQRAEVLEVQTHGRGQTTSAFVGEEVCSVQEVQHECQSWNEMKPGVSFVRASNSFIVGKLLHSVSWNDASEVSDGAMHVASRVDPAFILLPILEKVPSLLHHPHRPLRRPHGASETVQRPRATQLPFAASQANDDHECRVDERIPNV